MPLSQNTRGSLFMVVATAGFTINDALTKVASADMNAGQIMFVRGIFAVLLMGAIVWHQKALVPVRAFWQPAVLFRILGENAATIFFLIALAQLPLANTTAIMQALPLLITLAAALFLGERVGWRRILAILTGFVGVLIIVRPGFEGFNSFALFALLSVLFCAVRDLATRQIPPTVPSLLISLLTAASVMVSGGLLIAPMGGWTPMRTEMIALLALSAALVLIGYTFVIMAMRTGELSVIAPFRYAALIWSVALGLLIFGDVPDMPMIIGATIIVLSGIYTLLRERKVSRTKPVTSTTGPNMAADGL
ncbi:DMT family transporter [Tianweitania sediminis]|uniref:DMT family transporter n=1 Tax=Tianweitania sediminis TaxID=1502156 RepID=A0A8J7QZL8_9HYPH|nr:DMT family transporter [Tianweitania sediminis]MBP0439733.1 DMT family transporter [Tianweitania sediminis]HEV7415085.1 DMT family transporter [Tianweitania sediminis]